MTVDAFFRRATLGEVSRNLGLHPLELAGLLGVHGDLPRFLRFSRDEVAQLTAQAGLVPPPAVAMDGPADEPPARRALRRVAAQLVARVDSPERRDNLSRGLAEDEAVLVQRLVQELADVGLVSIDRTLRGEQVLVNDGKVDQLKAIAAGDDIPGALAAHWNG